MRARSVFQARGSTVSHRERGRPGPALIPAQPPPCRGCHRYWWDTHKWLWHYFYSWQHMTLQLLTMIWSSGYTPWNDRKNKGTGQALGLHGLESSLVVKELKNKDQTLKKGVQQLSAHGGLWHQGSHHCSQGYCSSVPALSLWFFIDYRTQAVICS